MRVGRGRRSEEKRWSKDEFTSRRELRFRSRASAILHRCLAEGVVGSSTARLRVGNGSAARRCRRWKATDVVGARVGPNGYEGTAEAGSSRG